MKTLNKILAFGLLAVMGIAASSCKKPVVTPEEEVKITLSVDVKEIVADGKAAATFKVVTDKNEDVTGEAVIKCTEDKSTVKGAKFTTAAAGTYTFEATYGKATSNTVKVTAKAVETPVDPVDPVEPEKPTQPQGENKWVTTDVRTPVKFADEGVYYGTSTSTGIEVTNTGTNYLTFKCYPGEEVLSYRVMCYPLSWIYNQLCEKLNQENKETLTVEDAEEVLLQYMTYFDYSEGVLAGRLFNGTSASLGESFPAFEIDWFNMDHQVPWQIQPDADYLLVTLSSFDEECTNPDSFADLAVCRFTVPERQLVGDPQVIIDVNASFSSYTVTYSANADCKYMYFLSNDAAQLDQYINLYGDKMYRDFLRHYGSMVPLDEPYVSNTNVQEILPDVTYAATAVALDANGSPAKVINRKDFTLKEKPAEEDRTLGTAKITNIRTASGLSAFHVEMDKYTYCIYQANYTLAEANRYMNDASDAERTALVNKLALEGWGHANVNFKFDSETNQITGEGYVDKEGGYWMDLKPETEYAILYITRNAFGDLSELQMSEPYKTKKLVRDQPKVYDPTFKFSLTAPSVTSLKYSFEYDPDVVAQFYFGCYYPIMEGMEDGYGEYGYPNEGSDRNTWMYWMFDFRDPNYGLPWPNAWATVGVKEGREETTLAGMEPGSTYKYACVYETWDGYVSEIIYQEATTAQVHFGADPQLQTTFSKDEHGTFHFSFTGNKDVGEIKYVGASTTNNASLFALEDLLLNDGVFYSEDDFRKMARRQLVDIGLTAKGNSTGMDVTAANLEGEDIYIVAAMGVGEKDGNPAYSAVEYYVWTKTSGVFKSLHDYVTKQ